jgi:hypothetical protein
MLIGLEITFFAFSLSRPISCTARVTAITCPPPIHRDLNLETVTLVCYVNLSRGNSGRP